MTARPDPTTDLAANWAKLKTELKATHDKVSAELAASLGQAADDLRRARTEHDEHEAAAPAHEDTTDEHEATPAIVGHLPMVIAMRAFDTHEDLGTIHVPITTETPRPAGSIPFGIGVTHADVRRAVTEHLGLDPLG
ncbi:hypothetical protein [Kocuria sp.]|uniref:hypothetical protein n=1 Tax=Kocuria sp. TaxID=1871328 RepID=UPI0026DA9FEF|nr:hypothetical protein [Kocuria sp.]MDO4920084.1 hypothetical protein [Kocuria sp.]